MKQGIRVAAVLLCSVAGWAWEAFEVSPAADIQQFPSVSGDVVVWQEYVYYEGGWDWDIYGVDLANDPFGLIVVASMSADQTNLPFGAHGSYGRTTYSATPMCGYRI
jgi:hypothetical protein